jgi:S-adenosylmethionine synthetase
MDGFVREIVATIQHVQSQVNSFIKMFLQAGKYIRNPDVLNIRLVIHEGTRVDL